jgi:hypothetical protein
MGDHKNIAQERLDEMFAEEKYTYAILFESISPTTTKQLSVDAEEGIDKYFALMKEAGLISYYKIYEKYNSTAWRMVFNNSSGDLGFANVYKLSSCKV